MTRVRDDDDPCIRNEATGLAHLLDSSPPRPLLLSECTCTIAGSAWPELAGIWGQPERHSHDNFMRSIKQNICSGIDVSNSTFFIDCTSAYGKVDVVETSSRENPYIAQEIASTGFTAQQSYAQWQ
jgi:hypothetical protein